MYDGVLRLFGVAPGVDEGVIRAALGVHVGENTSELLKSCEIDKGIAEVRFGTHEAALAIRRLAAAAAAPCTTEAEATAAVTAALGLPCAGADTLYNERSYDGRRAEEGRDDDDGRGWCALHEHTSRHALA